MTLAIVTATLSAARAEECVRSWEQHATHPPAIYLVRQGVDAAGRWVQQDNRHGYDQLEILGTVPAFALGVQKALDDGAEIIACLHDDLLIEEDGWDETVIRLFKACPRAGLCGFGGAKGLGSDDLYKTPYNPMQLARQGFRSNMRDAEAHGIRSTSAEPVACLDGFSQIGRADFWRCLVHPSLYGGPPELYHLSDVVAATGQNLFSSLEQLGVVHHFYDGMLGAFAKRLGWQVWYLPVKCHHFGGRTAVGDPRYLEWANTHATGDGASYFGDISGDQMYWIQAHKIGYSEFRNELPIRT